MAKNLLTNLYCKWLITRVLAIPLALLFTAQISAQTLVSNQNMNKQVRTADFFLTDVLDELEKKRGVTFHYFDEVLEGKRVKEAKDIRSNEDMDYYLNSTLSPLGLKFYYQDAKNIIIFKNEKERKKELRALSSSTRQFSVPVESINLIQNANLKAVSLLDKIVSGTVKDDQGEPMPGVSVLLKGTTTGTVTDVNGAFSLSVPDNSVLIFSFVGFLTEEVVVGSQSVYDIAMVSDLLSLGEIVVIGYGTQKKRDLTGSVAKIDVTKIESFPNSSIETSLQGMAPGVRITQGSGAPGGQTFTRIRGTSSLIGHNEPLYVIDGVPLVTDVRFGNSDGGGAGGQFSSFLAELNPADIESMEVLKDASATAIYGARASNGVILITTKRGKSGDGRIDFNSYIGVSKVTDSYDMMNAQEYVDFYNAVIDNTQEIDPGFSRRTDIDISEFDTDWQDELFREAIVKSYNLSASGGTDRTKYFVSGSYFDQEGIVRGSRLKRYSFRLNLDQKVNKKVKVGVNMAPSYSHNDRVGQGADRNGNVVYTALRRDPNTPVRNEDGTFTGLVRGVSNPVQEALERTLENTNKKLVGNMYGEYEIIEGLTLKVQLGTDYNSRIREEFRPTTIERFNRTSARLATTETFTWINENYLTWQKTLANDHNVTFLLGNSQQKTSRNSVRIRTDDGSNNIVTTTNNGSDIRSASNVIYEFGIRSFFLRGNYNFKGKYYLTATMRADGSSTFGEDNKYGWFPSVAASWRISDEPFMEQLRFLNDLKLRASYGITGNNGDAPNRLYQWAGPLSTGYDYLDGYAGVAHGRSQIPDNNFSWEETEQIDIGLDLAFFDNRVSSTIDYYHRESDNLWQLAQLPHTTGFNTVIAPVGGLKNYGWEFSLSTVNLQGELGWNTSFNISFNRNEITKLPSIPGTGITTNFIEDFNFRIGGTNDRPSSLYQVGGSIGQMYGYIYDGVDPETGNAMYRDIDGSGDLSPNSGRNPAGVGETHDFAVIGNGAPDHIGGFVNAFTYKGLDLKVFLNWAYGQDKYNFTKHQLIANRDLHNNNFLKEAADFWTPENLNAKYPRPYAGGLAESLGSDRPSSQWVEDASFLRIRDITLGYSLPKSTIEKIKVRSLRFYVSAFNLYTFTSYSGLDPEAQNQVNQLQSAIGYDVLGYPQARTFQFGVNIGL